MSGCENQVSVNYESLNQFLEIKIAHKLGVKKTFYCCPFKYQTILIPIILLAKKSKEKQKTQKLQSKMKTVMTLLYSKDVIWMSISLL